MQVQNFNDLPLSDSVLKGINAMGFKKPTQIQAESIAPLLKSRDVIGQARTGTGKTAAFAIPMVEGINLNDRQVQGLVLAPTRELAIQTAKHISKIGKYTNVKVCPIYGGQKISHQIKQLRKGVHIVVGTPGRILDHLGRGTLNLKAVKTVVLDEADRMLDMGFIKDINRILSKVPKGKQTSLFSATMDQNIWRICNEYMDNPEKILVSKDEIALEQINQKYVKVNHNNRYPILRELISDQQVHKAIIFTRTRRGAYRLSKKLKKSGYNARALHGELSQNQRDRVTKSFRKDKLNFLVATDIAARGLDIDGITHIINYNIPHQANTYFHRIGRTARMENEGMAITLVAPDEEDRLASIKNKTSTIITELKTSIKLKSGRKKKFDAICHNCKKGFKLPFKPTNGQPVYCPRCFRSKKHRNTRKQ
jgi:ATP-dependent RNA helicase DeaD